MAKLVTRTVLQLVLYSVVAVTLLHSLPNQKTRSKTGCAVCGRKTSAKFVSAANSLQDMSACFGREFEETGVLCASCLRALNKHKKNGKTYQPFNDLRRNTKGRPPRRQPIPPKPNDKPCTNEGSNWSVEETEFGAIRTGTHGEVLLPPGVFEEILAGSNFTILEPYS